MKRKIICALVIALLTLQAKGQNQQGTYLNLYASIGAKLLSEKSFHYDSKVTHGYSAVMGAGSLWNKGKILVGMECYYGHGSKRNEVRDVVFSGQNSSLLLGYKIDLNEKLTINLLSGAGYALNHIFITDNNVVPAGGYNSTIFHNNNIVVPAAVFIQYINDNGTIRDTHKKL